MPVPLSTLRSNQPSNVAQLEYSYQLVSYLLGPTQQVKKNNKVKSGFFSPLIASAPQMIHYFSFLCFKSLKISAVFVVGINGREKNTVCPFA